MFATVLTIVKVGNTCITTGLFAVSIYRHGPTAQQMCVDQTERKKKNI